MDNLRIVDIVRVSTDAQGRESLAHHRGEASMSPDGVNVVFVSNATHGIIDELPDSHNFNHLLLKNLQTNEIVRLSERRDGRVYEGSSWEPVFSPDGAYLAFSSKARNVAPGDGNKGSDIFLKDLATGLATMVSRTSDDQYGRGDSVAPVFSPDGRHIAFLSTAFRLNEAGEPVPALPASRRPMQVYLKDLESGALTLVSRNPDGGAATTSSLGKLSFSPDGRKLAFATVADLVPEDTNDLVDVFVAELATGAITRISTDSNGAQIEESSWYDNFANGAPVFLTDNRVAFISAGGLIAKGGGDLIEGPGTPSVYGNKSVHIVIKNIDDNSVFAIRTNGSGQNFYGTGQLSASPDGRLIAFHSGGQGLGALTVMDVLTGEFVAVRLDDPALIGGSARDLTFSADSSQLIFTSHFNTFVEGDTNKTPYIGGWNMNNPDVFVATIDVGPIPTLSHTPVPFRLEAEDMTILSSFSIDDSLAASGGRILKAPVRDGEGRAGFVFREVSGSYDVTIGHFDESDGVSTLALRVNDVEIDSFLFDADSGSAIAGPSTRATRLIEDVALAVGDRVEIVGRGDGGEPLRVDFLDFAWAGELF